MVLHEFLGQNEDHPVYRELAKQNLSRQYGFLESTITASINGGWNKVSNGLIRALNYHAIACLHVNAGEFRPCEVVVGNHEPPPHYLVPELMNEFVNDLNRSWQEMDPIGLSAYALWRLNWIHPFINGNGRTARALCYYLICVKLGTLLPGRPMLPQLILAHRQEQVRILAAADDAFRDGRSNALEPLQAFVERLVRVQIQGG